MNTCLSGLWDLLIEEYYREMQDKPADAGETVCRVKMRSLIDAFYSGEKPKPLHMERFWQELSKNGASIRGAAEIAAEEAEKCGLCVSCYECAKKFYEILQGKKEERPLAFELKNYFADNSQIYYYLSAYKTVRSYRRIRNALICLKGFSSTTPAIYSAAFEDTCAGGGLYLNVDGFGIVIDPGIGFVDSMHKQGIFIEDIHAVIVTHNHLDHNADLRTISALLHDINRYYSGQAKFYQSFFQGIEHKEHVVSWWLDEGTREANKEIIPESGLLSQCDKWIKLNDKVSLAAIETKHMRKGKSYGIKCRISLDGKEKVIGYTSDTKYFPEIAEFMAECGVVVFNISDIYEKDVRGAKQKSSHLGYDGSINLLQGEKQQFRLAIASEFCCSNGDYRMSVTKSLNNHVNKKRAARVIPGETGLKVDMRSEGIYCSRCKRIAPLSSVSVISSEREFGSIQYVCKNCQY